ncbi:MAG: DUF1311 domain-containing protein [Rhizobiales bacterium]|nr:DUF1311 domain-containing protein [Hyphomicrobiales bacterium]
MIASLILPLLMQSADALPECDQAAADKGIQADMNQCAYRDFLIADAALNAQWIITRAKTRKDDADFAASGSAEFDTREGHFASLLEAQRGWLRYRDAHCALEGYIARGGSLEPLLNSSCKTRLTQERTEELKALAQEL